jgi:hypothetical protein
MCCAGPRGRLPFFHIIIDTVGGIDVLPWLAPRDSNPTHYLCGRRAVLRFTVRRPASAEVSPCCHRPSGGDVACSVHIGVGGPRTAGLALEDRLALAVFWCDVPARRTSLRRVCGRDLLDPAASLLLYTHGVQAPTASATMPGQQPRLLSVRKQPITQHNGNLAATTDKSPKGEAALLPPAAARSYHAATIR